MNVVRKLASLRLTWVAIAMLIPGVLLYYAGSHPLWLTLPLIVLSANLGAALLVTSVFRRHPALLLFHLCLLVLLILAGYGSQAQFRGRVELAQGQALSDAIVAPLYDGMLHDAARLASLDFVQNSFDVGFAPGLFRTQTNTRVTMNNGEIRQFGDNTPLVLSGYRFYTTSNKGYAALVQWRPDQGAGHLGVVNFPSYPANDWNQRIEWTAPDDTAMTLELQRVTLPARDGVFTFNGETPYPKRLRIGTERGVVSIAAGEVVRLGRGSLVFVGVRRWMGYAIYHFPNLGLMFAVALLGTLALGGHYCSRLGLLPRRRSARTRSVTAFEQSSADTA